jgi:hypothetical protein
MDDSATEKMLDEVLRVVRREPAAGERERSAAAVVSGLVDAIKGPAKAGGATAHEDLGTAWSTAVSTAFSGVAESISRAASGNGGGGPAFAAVLKTGFGLAPLITSLFGLFSRGDSEDAAPTLAKYVMPARLEIAQAAGRWGLSDVDYGQTGTPRPYGGSYADAQPAAGDRTGAAAAPVQASSGAPQITVNVQAMDARSFLDRSADIAAAVRDAMLHLNSVNDVVNDL